MAMQFSLFRGVVQAELHHDIGCLTGWLSMNGNADEPKRCCNEG